MIIAEYIWIDGTLSLRSKARVLDIDWQLDIEAIPEWNYDGSSTQQATGKNSEIILKPRSIYPCPFRGNGCLVMCDTFLPNGDAAKNNHRFSADLIFKSYESEKPWYGIEQEYFICSQSTGLPIGFNPEKKQGNHYCGVGTGNAIGRGVSEKHLEYCLFAGLKISGTNAEVSPGQWEFQVGPVEGIAAADQLWVARYILGRVGELYEVVINYHPKVLSGEWNGSGCHINFSTEKMRGKNGLDHILSAMDPLEKAHQKHMDVYGVDNNQRMSGMNETSKIDKFSYGFGDRGASVRIPLDTKRNNCGYFEDRRPASNVDPYQGCSIILSTIMENGS